MKLEAFTENSKTLLSIDFDRFTTCPQICEYCYVGNLERLYPAYKAKIKRNDNRSKENPTTFAQQLNSEYKKLRKSKSKKYTKLDKLPVRVYGSGDFIPDHLLWLNQLEFKFYLISKSLTNLGYHKYIKQLLEIPNLTKIILSLDDQNLMNYDLIKHFKGADRFGLAYTGMADDYNHHVATGKLSATIFFNISNKHTEKAKSRLIKEQCPCDSGVLKLAKSCSFCNKCWRSTKTKGQQWNTLMTDDHVASQVISN